MNKLSIPSIERLPGFERFDNVVVAADRMTFIVVGSNSEFGASAANLFVTHGLVASLDGHEGHPLSVEVTQHVGSNFCTVSCSLPR